MIIIIISMSKLKNRKKILVGFDAEFYADSDDICLDAFTSFFS